MIPPGAVQLWLFLSILTLEELGRKPHEATRVLTSRPECDLEELPVGTSFQGKLSQKLPSKSFIRLRSRELVQNPVDASVDITDHTRWPFT